MGLAKNNLVLVGAGILIGVGVGILLLALLSLGGLMRSGGTSLLGEQRPAPQMNQPAPDFERLDLKGTKVRLSSLRGTTVLVNFWATWCDPCRREMPLLKKYHQKYPRDLVILAVDDDEPAERVQAYVDEMGLEFKVLLDPDREVGNQYRVRAFPTTLFVDADGNIRFEQVGVMSETQLQGYLDQLGVER